MSVPKTGLHMRYYRQEWENLPLCKGWLVPAPNAQAMCKFCEVILRPHITELRRHGKSAKHRRKVEEPPRGTTGHKIVVESMPKISRNRYLKSWEDLPECMGWLGQSRNGKSAICRVCKLVLEPNLGELKKHGGAKRHLECVEKIHKQQEEDERNASVIQPWMKASVKKRHLEWKVCLLAASETHFRGTDKICSILSSNFTDQVFQMTGEQCQYLAEFVVAPHFKDKLRESLGDLPFTLVLDDSRQISLTKRVSVLIRYYCSDYNDIVTTYMGSVPLERVDVSVLATALLELLVDEWNLEGGNLFGLVTDGLEELDDQEEPLLTQLRDTCPNAVHLRSSFTSLAKVIDRAVRKNLPPEIEYLLRESFNWFAVNPDRQVEHRDLMAKLGFGKIDPIDEGVEDDFHPTVGDSTGFRRLKPISPGHMQWSVMIDYISDLTSEYESLKSHFQSQMVEGQCFASKILHDIIASHHVPVYLTMMQPLLQDISRLRVLFKLNVNQNVKICDKVEEYFLSLAAMVLHPKHQETSVQELCELDITTEGNSLAGDKVGFGSAFEDQLSRSQLGDQEKANIIAHSAAFVRDLVTGFQFILKDSLPLITVMDHFSVPNFLEAPLLRDHLVAPFFPQDDDILVALEEKYKLLKMLTWKNTSDTKAFWFDVHTFGDDPNGSSPLSLLSSGVLRMLTVPLFCSETNEAFAQMNTIRKECHHMRPDLVETICHIRFGLRRMGHSVSSFKPPLDLLAAS